MFTDIVGYSRFKEVDALSILEKHDALTEPIILRKNGTVVKRIGDAIFAVFASTDDCINSALEIQKKIIERNKIANSKEIFSIRIGIHYGEVIEKNNDFFGDNINICSRIETLSDPDSIIATDSLISELLFINRIYYNEIGFVKLKNINHPQKVYKVYNTSNDQKSESVNDLVNDMEDNGCIFVDISNYSNQTAKSIAIGFIENIDDSKEIDHLCYNLTQEITSDFSNVKNFRVSSFNDVIQLQNQNYSNSDILLRLKVSYYLSCSINYKNSIYYFNFSFFSMEKGDFIWSELFEVKSNFDELKFNVITSVLNILEEKLPKDLDQKYNNKIKISENVKNLYSEAIYLSEISKEKSKIKQSIDLLDKVISDEPEFVNAYIKNSKLNFEFGNQDRAIELLDIGLEVSGNSKNKFDLAKVNNMAGIIYRSLGKYEKAEKHFKNALYFQLKLNNPIDEAQYRNNLSSVYNFMNKTEEALEQAKLSIALKEENEAYEMLGTSYANLSNTYFSKDNFTESIIYARKALAIFRSNGEIDFEARILLILAQNYINIGFKDIANKYLKNVSIILDHDAYRTGKDYNFLLAKTKSMFAQIQILNNNYKESKILFEKADLLFKKTNNGRVIIKNLFSLLRLMIIINHDSIMNVFLEINELVKKYNLLKEFKITLSILELYFIQSDKSENIDYVENFKNFKEHDSLDEYDIWLYIVIFNKFSIIDQLEDAEKMLNEKINKLSLSNTSNDHVEAFLMKGFLVTFTKNKQLTSLPQEVTKIQFDKNKKNIYTYYAANAMNALINKYDDLDQIVTLANEIAIKMVEMDNLNNEKND